MTSTTATGVVTFPNMPPREAITRDVIAAATDPGDRMAINAGYGGFVASRLGREATSEDWALIRSFANMDRAAKPSR